MQDTVTTSWRRLSDGSSLLTSSRAYCRRKETANELSRQTCVTTGT